MAVAASSGASAPRFTPAVVGQARAAPPSVETMREFLARRIDGGGLKGKWWLGFCKKKYHIKDHLFIGVLTPTCRGFGIVTNLSRNWIQITADKEDFHGDKLDFNQKC
jgi:hypothetical protein